MEIGQREREVLSVVQMILVGGPAGAVASCEWT